MWRQQLTRHLHDIWYHGRAVPWYLAALARVYASLMRLRCALYRTGWKRAERISKPVIVIGNITAGGTGKTPLTIWLVRELERRGWKPGVVTRGYGASESGPLLVDPNGSATRFGDEAILIARATRIPVMLARRRARGAQLLSAREDCDVILTDDGLQHWALARDFEIAVIDGARRFGNQQLLPAGPLREPVQRLQRVDFVVSNGVAQTGEIPMRVVGTHALRLGTGERKCLSDFTGQHVHAVAGIGNPARFFDMLQTAGLLVQRHAFDDHHVYSRGDLNFGNDWPILMTEKDAVKCEAQAQLQIWIVPAEVELPDSFADAVHAALLQGRANSSKEVHA